MHPAKLRISLLFGLNVGLYALFGCTQQNDSQPTYHKSISDGISVPPQITAQLENLPDGEMYGYVSVDGAERKQLIIADDGNTASLTIDQLSPGPHALLIEFEFVRANETQAIELANTNLPINLTEGSNKPYFGNIDYELPDDDGDNISNIDELAIGSNPKIADIPAIPLASVAGGIKTLSFSWSEAKGADYYQVLENPDGVAGFSVIAQNITALNYVKEIPVHLTHWLNARYMVEACNIAGCNSSAEVTIENEMLNTIGYFKASNTGADDRFGFPVALSADGNTLIVGAYTEDSANRDVNGSGGNDDAVDAGAVYVYTNEGDSNWQQQAYIKASNSEAGDLFGFSVALSADGNTLAIGAFREDGGTAVINGDETNNDTSNSGAVYIFSRIGADWLQQAYIKAYNAGEGDQFGYSVSLSDDGKTLAVGANNEDSSSKFINGDGADDLTGNAGAVYIFTYSETKKWQQQAYVKAFNSGANDEFGCSVSLNEDGNTLAIGARGEASNSKSINGDEKNNSALNAGAAYIFTRSGTEWQKQAYIKGSNSAQGHQFGFSVAVSDNGNTLAVGAIADGKDVIHSGAVYIFARSDSEWQQQDLIKALNPDSHDDFGYSVALSGDGNTLGVGARFEDSNAVGINGDQSNNDTLSTDNGAAYLYVHDGVDWQRQSYVKASNAGGGIKFSESVALNVDGSALAVGAPFEDGSAVGINGDLTNDCNAALPTKCTKDSGAVYLY